MAITRPKGTHPLARMMMDAARTGGYYDSDAIREAERAAKKASLIVPPKSLKMPVLDESASFDKSTWDKLKEDLAKKIDKHIWKKEFETTPWKIEPPEVLDPAELGTSLMDDWPFKPETASSWIIGAGKPGSGMGMGTTVGVASGTGILDPKTMEDLGLAVKKKHDGTERAKKKALDIIGKKLGAAAVDAPGSVEGGDDERLARALARNKLVPTVARGRDWVAVWMSEYNQVLELAIENGETLEASAAREAVPVPSPSPRGNKDDVADALAAIRPRQEHSPEVQLERALDQAELEQDPDYGKW